MVIRARPQGVRIRYLMMSLPQENYMKTPTSENTPSSSAMPGNGDGTLHNVSSGAHAAVNSMAGAAEEAARNFKPAIDRVSAMAHQAVEKAAGVAAPTADWLAAKGESLNATQKKLVEDSCSYVSAHPLKAIGLALAAGFLLSRLAK
jgi:ElaB/YqjD/DUF883 family membrane-anchored ribosome-binding protein